MAKVIHCQWNFFILFLTSYSLDLFSLTYIQPDIYLPRRFRDPSWLPALLLLGTSLAPTAPWQKGMERRRHSRSLHNVLPNLPWSAVISLLSCFWQKNGVKSGIWSHASQSVSPARPWTSAHSDPGYRAFCETKGGHSPCLHGLLIPSPARDVLPSLLGCGILLTVINE